MAKPRQQQCTIVAIAFLFLFYVSYFIHKDVRTRRLSYFPTHMGYPAYPVSDKQEYEEIVKHDPESHDHFREQLDDLLGIGGEDTPIDDDPFQAQLDDLLGVDGKEPPISDDDAFQAQLDKLIGVDGKETPISDDPLFAEEESYDSLRAQLDDIVGVGGKDEDPLSTESVPLEEEHSEDQGDISIDGDGGLFWVGEDESSATQSPMTEADEEDPIMAHILGIQPAAIESSKEDEGDEEDPSMTTASFDGEPSFTETGPYVIISQLSFETGVLEPPGHNYTRGLVIAHTSEEDISWVDDTFGDDELLEKAMYAVDRPEEPYTMSASKGHEVMAYLTYIINFYDDLPDVCIFMHAQLTAWHNNELLEGSSAKMVQNLNLRKVIREGYVNLRCHRLPSCPDHPYPIAVPEDQNDIPQEQVLAEEAWKQILPHEEVPQEVLQPSGGQFAVSRERIRLLPREQYEHFRKWLLNTTTEDWLSGRVWEYIYLYIWLGTTQLCPEEHICYCDTYGVCFGGKAEYEDHYSQRGYVGRLEKMSKEEEEKEDSNQVYLDDVAKMLERARQEVEKSLENAMLRGADPQNRAMEVGREWHEGDGF